MIPLAPRNDATATEFRREAFSGTVAFLLSACGHTIILLCLALWTYAARQEPTKLTLKLDQSEAAMDEAMFMVRAAAVEPTAIDSYDEPSQAIEVAPPAMAPLTEAARLEVEPVEQAVWLEQLDQTVAALRAASTVSIPQRSDRAPSTNTTPQRKLVDGANYYGIEVTGKKFVFVVDASLSMMGARWNSAVKELGDCIAGLPPDCQYHVIFFSDRTQFMHDQLAEETEFEPASTENVLKTRRWIERVSLGPSTRPLLALRTAVLMGPDAIFLLSDGEFRDHSLQWVRSQVAGRQGSELPALPPIHTIGLLSNFGLPALSEIAQRTGGQFRQVRSW